MADAYDLSPTERFGLWKVLSPAEESIFDVLVDEPFGLRVKDIKAAVYDGHVGHSTVYTTLMRLRRRLAPHGWVLERLPSQRYLLWRNE